MWELDCYLRQYDSATVALQRLIGDCKITISHLSHDKNALPEVFMPYLNEKTTQKLCFRHILLRAGDNVLSHAYNWFLPQYLTKHMLVKLQTTDEAFGHVVSKLNFKRKPLRSVFHWDSQACEISTANTILSHQAVLFLPDGTPFSFVEENYPADLLNHIQISEN